MLVEHPLGLPRAERRRACRAGSRSPSPCPRSRPGTGRGSLPAPGTPPRGTARAARSRTVAAMQRWKRTSSSMKSSGLVRAPSRAPASASSAAKSPAVARSAASSAQVVSIERLASSSCVISSRPSAVRSVRSSVGIASERTKTPPRLPRRTSTMPARRGRSIASRTTGRLTPKRLASSWSRGRRRPGRRGAGADAVDQRTHHRIRRARQVDVREGRRFHRHARVGAIRHPLT